MVPVKSRIGGIVHPPIGRKNTTYIPLIGLAFWGGLYATYHLLREPETTIDLMLWKKLWKYWDFQIYPEKNNLSSWWFFANAFEKFGSQIASFPQGSG